MRSSYAEKHQFPYRTHMPQCVLGQARAQLGRATEGIALIREGNSWFARNRVALRHLAIDIALADAQASRALSTSLETVEQALQANPDELVYAARDASDTRRTAAQTRDSTRSRRSRFPRGDRARAIDEREGWELRATRASRGCSIAGPSRRSAHDARRNLRLVHRRLRHRRLERRQGAARRVSGLINMLCSKCSTDNRADAKFCAKCGASCESLCPACRHR